MFDVIAVFAFLTVAMILPALMFKSALTSKQDKDYLNPTDYGANGTTLPNLDYGANRQERRNEVNRGSW